MLLPVQANRRAKPPFLRLLAVSFLTLLSALPGCSAAQSLDCHAAATAIEATICADPGLSDLDLRLAHTVQALLQADPGQRVALRHTQARWLAAREADCGGLDENARLACLGAHYGQRIEELEGIDDPAGGPELELCRKLVERYRPLADGRPRESLLDVLDMRAGSGLALDDEARFARTLQGECGARKIHAQLDGAPVILQECFGDGPSMTATLRAAPGAGTPSGSSTRSGSGKEAGPACRAAFSFAPSFDVAPLHPGSDHCQNDNCGALRVAARRLAELAQADLERARGQLEGELSPGQRRLWQAAVAHAQADPRIAMADAGTSGGQAALVGTSHADFLPALVAGRAWLVRLTHALEDDRTCADWMLDFQALEGPPAGPVHLQVGMGRGRLLGVAVVPMR